MTCDDELKLPLVWNLSARAMISAGKNVRNARQAASGLYAQGILGISEEDCRRAKAPEVIDHLTLVDCLSLLAAFDNETGEKIMTGLMMLAYSDGHMTALEVRWASMVSEAIGLSPDGFQKCAVNARVIATMLAVRGEEQEAAS